MNNNDDNNNKHQNGSFHGSSSLNAVETAVGTVSFSPNSRTSHRTISYLGALPKWYPKFRGKPLYHGNPEALAWAIDSIARAVQFIGAGAFLGTALIRIATEAAGCSTEADEDGQVPECDKKIYGIQPSSLLTTYTMIVGVSSAALLPFMGAVIDYTPHRLLVGQISSTLCCILIFPQIFLNEHNFFSIAIIQVITSFVGWAQTAITYAYLPELSRDELRLAGYTKNFTICSFLSMVLYLALVIGTISAVGRGDEDLLASKVGMSIAFCVNVVLLSLAWGGSLFQKRDKLHPSLPPNTNLFTAGFVQLYNTTRHIIWNYRALKWFYLSICMSDAGLQALATISITYLTDQLQFTARENGIAIMIMLLGSIPGAVVANFFTRTLDPLKSSILALTLLIVTTTMFAIFLKPHVPNQYLQTYILSFIWGLGTGWKWTCDRLVASCIIPQDTGQDAELMGVFLFSGQCLSWLPPLVFTAINESGVSQRVGVASLNAFFLLALLCYLCMGGYTEARNQVNRTATYFNHNNQNGASNNTTHYTTDTIAMSNSAAAVAVAVPTCPGSSSSSSLREADNVANTNDIDQVIFLTKLDKQQNHDSGANVPFGVNVNTTTLENIH